MLQSEFGVFLMPLATMSKLEIRVRVFVKKIPIESLRNGAVRDMSKRGMGESHYPVKVSGCHRERENKLQLEWKGENRCTLHSRACKTHTDSCSDRGRAGSDQGSEHPPLRKLPALARRRFSLLTGGERPGESAGAAGNPP